MLQQKNLLFCLLALFTASCAHISVKTKKEDDSEPCFKTFAVSTEMEIGKAWPIIDKAPKGLFVSVGAERSFRLFSMADRADELYILDISPRVLRYATINRELLAANTLEEYRELRFASDFKSWQSLQKSGPIEHILTADDFSWWSNEVRDLFAEGYTLPEMLNRYETDILYKDFLRFYNGFKKLYAQPKKIRYLMLDAPIKDIDKSLDFSLDDLMKWRQKLGASCFLFAYRKDPSPPLNIASVINFKHGNYLFDKKLYKNLHEAAKNKRIHINHVNLANNKQRESFIRVLKNKAHKLALLDLNNTYRPEYIGDPEFMNIVTSLAPLAKDDSVLLLMSNISNFMCTQYQSYFGFRFALLKALPKDFPFGRYISVLSAPVITHMDQKLYDTINLPPHMSTWEDLQ